MIHLGGVTKRFGSRLALSDFSLDVEPGEVVALAGPNGAGKSTALKIVLGIVRQDSGTARINGFDVSRDPERARGLVGYMPQRLAFPDHVTGKDLARLVGSLRGIPLADAVRWLGTVGLADRLGAPVRELSGGQRQRLSLALALLSNPRALVLDEPSISLDADGAEVVRDAIRAARWRGAEVLFASHHLDEVSELADRVVVLKAGHRVAEAEPATLKSGAFTAFYRGAVTKGVVSAA